MCNLYSISTNQAAISALFRVVNRYVGNLAPMPGVFPDYTAPIVRTGAEVAKRARQTRPDLPIIFASGYSETAALTPVQESKHSRMLHKPFKVGELQSALAELLARPD